MLCHTTSGSVVGSKHQLMDTTAELGTHNTLTFCREEDDPDRLFNARFILCLGKALFYRILIFDAHRKLPANSQKPGHIARSACYYRDHSTPNRRSARSSPPWQSYWAGQPPPKSYRPCGTLADR